MGVYHARGRINDAIINFPTDHDDNMCSFTEQRKVDFLIEYYFRLLLFLSRLSKARGYGDVQDGRLLFRASVSHVIVRLSEQNAQRY